MKPSFELHSINPSYEDRFVAHLLEPSATFWQPLLTLCSPASGQLRNVMPFPSRQLTKLTGHPGRDVPPPIMSAILNLISRPRPLPNLQRRSPLTIRTPNPLTPHQAAPITPATTDPNRHTPPHPPLQPAQSRPFHPPVRPDPELLRARLRGLGPRGQRRQCALRQRRGGQAGLPVGCRDCADVEAVGRERWAWGQG